MKAKSHGQSSTDGPTGTVADDLLTDSSPGTVQAVQRSLRLLLVLAQAPRPRTLQELSVVMGCSVSTVHRMLSTLSDFHLVEKEPLSRRYRLGPAVFHLATARAKQTDLRELALPHMERLSDASLETISLEMRFGQQLVTLDTIESIQEVRLVGTVGVTTPIRELGAKCKVVLAFLPPAEQERILDQVRWERVGFTRTTLREALIQVREEGVARSFGERLPGAASLAAPILDNRGEVVGSIAVAGPSGRWTAKAMAGIEPLLREVTHSISAELGFGVGLVSPVSVDPAATEVPTQAGPALTASA
jgi:DNA-binding IclR family transcriptional regulator